jgi:hypothetical protein
MYRKRWVRWLLCLPFLGAVGVVATEECLYRAALSGVPALPGKPERVSMPPSWPLLRWLALEDTVTPQVEPFWPGSISWMLLKAWWRDGRLQEAQPVGTNLANTAMRHHASQLAREGHKYPRGPQRLALTLWFTRNWSAEELLAYDAEHVFLGSGATGVRDGATVILGEDWTRLDAADVALLIAVSEAPSRMNPWCAPERVRARRDWLLKRLREAGGLTAEEAEAELRAPLGVAARPAHLPPCPVRNGGASPPPTEDKRP